MISIGAELSEMKPPETGVKRPRGLKAAGKKLWDATTAEFDFAEHEVAMLEEACRTRDRIVELDAAVASDGLMLASSQGMRVHPAVAESRQQRLVLARVLVSLGVPPLVEEGLPNSRGVRGVYGGGRR